MDSTKLSTRSRAGSSSQVVALARAGLVGRRVAVRKAGVDLVPAIRAHQALVHLARGLLSVAHGVAHVAGAGDQVAARVELAAAGFERVAVHFERAVLLDAQAAGAQEILVDGFAHRQDDGVAFQAADLFGGHRPAPAGGVELAQARLDHFNAP